MTWLWLLPYLVVGIVLARWLIHRYRDVHVSELDAFLLMALWPVFLVFIGLRAAVTAIGAALGGGKR